MLQATRFLLLLSLITLSSVCSFHVGKRFLTATSLITKISHTPSVTSPSLQMTSTNEPLQQEVGGFDIGAWLNPNTRGGVLVWCFLLTSVPIAFYQFFVSQGLEGTTVGAYVGAIFVLLSNLLWASTYIFRVANKDMTYAKQLKEYENAVLQKRLEELGDDEINALMEEIEMDGKKPRPAPISPPEEF